MEYNLKIHKHRFAIWTAARAVQRSWTSTKNVSLVIHKIDLFNFADNYVTLSRQHEFDEKHVVLCEKMIDEFHLLGVEKVSYGRVAKIVAVYLKTSVILNADNKDEKIKLIHPPIDRIILKKLSAKQGFRTMRTLNWTQLNKDKYWKMVNTFREQLGFFDWRVEMAWFPELDK